MNTIRTFIALELSAELQEELKLIQNQLKASEADVNWVRPENIHLTLKFLGNISPGIIEEIKKHTNTLAAHYKSFNLSLGKIGAFPTLEHPRVIWAGIDQGKNKTIEITKKLEEQLINTGFLPEKREFNPHLTLGRVRSARNRDQLKKLIPKTAFSQKNTQADTITIFKSTLTPQGAIYEALYRKVFSGSF